MIDFVSDQERHPFDAEAPEGESLLVGRRQVWVVVSPCAAALESSDWIGSPGARHEAAPMRVCREVLEGGMLVLADADPDQDALMSSLLNRDRCGEA